MNNERRKVLKRAIASLDVAESYIETALDEERDCLYNMPESLECSERYEKMEEAISKLEEAIDRISDARDCVWDASE